METIVFINQKGGVGKTVSAVNFSYSLVLLKKKVLLIDLAPQSGGASRAIRSIYNAEKASTVNSAELLIQDEKIFYLPTKLNNFFILPSSPALKEVKKEFSSEPVGKGLELRKKVKMFSEHTDIDFVVLDTAPEFDVLIQNTLMAANVALVPILPSDPDVVSAVTAKKTIDSIKRNISEYMDKSQRWLEHDFYFFNRVEPRLRLTDAMFNVAKKLFKEKLCDTFIRKNTRLAEAEAEGSPVYIYDKRSYGAEDYLHLAKEILRRIRVKEAKNAKKA